jgi:hypothetical protein
MERTTHLCVCGGSDLSQAAEHARGVVIVDLIGQVGQCRGARPSSWSSQGWINER